MNTTVFAQQLAQVFMPPPAPETEKCGEEYLFEAIDSLGANEKPASLKILSAKIISTLTDEGCPTYLCCLRATIHASDLVHFDLPVEWIQDPQTKIRYCQQISNDQKEKSIQKSPLLPFEFKRFATGDIAKTQNLFLPENVSDLKTIIPPYRDLRVQFYNVVRLEGDKGLFLYVSPK